MEPLAVAVPSPLRAVSRSMTSRLLAIEAASERSRSTMPVSGSMKPPPSEVTRPANCGAVAGPVIAMSTLSAPRSTAPREASRGLPSDSGTPPCTLRLSGAPAAVPTVPVTWSESASAPVMRLVSVSTRLARLPSAVMASGPSPALRAAVTEAARQSAVKRAAGAAAVPVTVTLPLMVPSAPSRGAKLLTMAAGTLASSAVRLRFAPACPATVTLPPPTFSRVRSKRAVPCCTTMVVGAARFTPSPERV